MVKTTALLKCYFSFFVRSDEGVLRGLEGVAILFKKWQDGKFSMGRINDRGRKEIKRWRREKRESVKRGNISAHTAST